MVDARGKGIFLWIEELATCVAFIGGGVEFVMGVTDLWSGCSRSVAGWATRAG